MANPPIEIRDHRDAPYVCDNRLIDDAGRYIGPYGIAVYNSLLRYAKPNKDNDPPIEKIAKNTGMSPRQARRAICDLEKYKMIKVKRSMGENNKYYLQNESVWLIPRSTEATQSSPPPVTEATQSPILLRSSNTKEKEETLLSLFLFEEIIKANPHSKLKALSETEKRKTIDRWAEDIRLLIDKDKQDPAIVRHIILKATHDSKFWARNILSGDALRRHWDRLTHYFPPPKESGTPELFDKPTLKRAFSFDRAGNKIDIATGAIIELVQPASKETPDQIQAAIRQGLNQGASA